MNILIERHEKNFVKGKHARTPRYAYAREVTSAILAITGFPTATIKVVIEVGKCYVV